MHFADKKKLVLSKGNLLPLTLKPLPPEPCGNVKFFKIQERYSNQHTYSCNRSNDFGQDYFPYLALCSFLKLHRLNNSVQKASTWPRKKLARFWWNTLQEKFYIIKSWTEKDKYMISLICRFQKDDRNELIYKTNSYIGLENMVVVVHSLSHVRLFTAPWTAATWLLCLPLSSRVCSNSCPLSRWCYLIISSSAASFSLCLQLFQASGSFPMTWLFVSGGQNIGASASASVLATESLCYPPETLWINYTSVFKKELNIFLPWIINWNFLKLKFVTFLANTSSPLFLRHPLGPAGPQSLWDNTLWRAPLRRTSLGTVPFPKSLPSPTFSCT